MFLLNIMADVFFIYLLAAVLPAVILLIYIYRQDTIEKEPPELVAKCIGMGAAAALVSIILEEIGENILNAIIKPENPHYEIFLAFVVVACVEEGTKLFFLYKATWRNPNFDYRFDGIVYAVATSLGFAALENIGYVFNYGITVAPTRALLAIPGHLSFAVFMGYFYARAKIWADRGDWGMTVFNIICGYASAVFLHGFYDSCAMIGTTRANIVFIIFVILMFFIVFRLVRHESQNDRPIDNRPLW